MGWVDCPDPLQVRDGAITVCLGQADQGEVKMAARRIGAVRQRPLKVGCRIGQAFFAQTHKPAAVGGLGSFANQPEKSRIQHGMSLSTSSAKKSGRKGVRTLFMKKD